MKKRLWEAGKTGLIVVLVFAMVLLTAAALPAETIRTTPWLSTVLQPLAAVLGLPEAEVAYVQQAQPITDAAQPLTITVRNSAGRYTAQWDFAQLDGAYESLGGLLGEALDTAQAVMPASQAQVERAMSLPGFCFDYGFALPAELLASWLDAGQPADASAASKYVLAAEADEVVLYLVAEQACRAATQIDPENFTALLEQFKPDGSQLAFETDSVLAPLSVRPGGMPDVKHAQAASACDSRYIETLATALGFNAYDENRYTDKAGVTYFSETNCALQIGSDGKISLRSSAPERFRASELTLQAQVELARSMVELAAGEVLGEARIYLSGVNRQDGQTICTFDYVLDGIPVSCGSDPAATVTFSGQSVTQMRLLVSTFTLTGGQISVLPPEQAEAILPAGSRLDLQYDRTNVGELTAGWRLSGTAGEGGR